MHSFTTASEAFHGGMGKNDGQGKGKGQSSSKTLNSQPSRAYLLILLRRNLSLLVIGADSLATRPMCVHNPKVGLGGEIYDTATAATGAVAAEVIAGATAPTDHLCWDLSFLPS